MDTRLSINLAKFGLSVTLNYETGTVCPCVAGGGFDDYSPQWHVDNPEPGDEDCAGKKIISTTAYEKTLKVLVNDIRALTNTVSLSSEILDAIGKLSHVDYALIGCADTKGYYFDATGYDEHVAYWTINGTQYVTKRVFEQFSNQFEGDLILVSRKQ